MIRSVVQSAELMEAPLPSPSHRPPPPLPLHVRKPPMHAPERVDAQAGVAAVAVAPFRRAPPPLPPGRKLGEGIGTTGQITRAAITVTNVTDLTVATTTATAVLREHRPVYAAKLAEAHGWRARAALTRR